MNSIRIADTTREERERIVAESIGNTAGSATEHRPVHMVLPSPVSWVPDVRPSSEEETPKKTPPGTAFRPDWETQFTEGKASEPPAEKKRPYCPWRSRLPECELCCA